MRLYWIAVFVLISLPLAGCASFSPTQEEYPPLDLQAPPSESAVTNTPGNPVQLGKTLEPEEMPSTPPPVEKFVSLAMTDLSERLHIDVESIVLVETTEMIWPNAALGCPTPGKVYPQGKVPGYQITLAANSVEYVYNTDWTGQVILCMEQGPNGTLEPVSTVGPEIGVPIK